jgi:death-on-curing protein
VKSWRWIGVDVALAIHDRQMAEHGGLQGTPHIAAVEAALARPRNRAVYARPDAARLAAAYAWGLIRAHGFADGNKRTAWVVARLFLADNGWRMQFEKADAVRVMQGVAAGTIAEDALAHWFRDRIERQDR